MIIIVIGRNNGCGYRGYNIVPPDFSRLFYLFFSIIRFLHFYPASVRTVFSEIRRVRARPCACVRIYRTYPCVCVCVFLYACACTSAAVTVTATAAAAVVVVVVVAAVVVLFVVYTRRRCTTRRGSVRDTDRHIIMNAYTPESRVSLR